MSTADKLKPILVRGLTSLFTASHKLVGAKKRNLATKILEFMEEYKTFIIMEYEATNRIGPYNAAIADKFLKTQREFDKFIEKY
jgi:hypothetical protein